MKFKYAKYLLPTATGLALVFSAVLGLGSSVLAQQDKVTICHRTDSYSNPYVVNQPDKTGDVGGHDGHDGPIFPAVGPDGKWGDIIPPFDYGSGLHYPGKNWTAQGQAIWENDCDIPEASPSPSPSPEVSPSPSPSASPSPSPSPEVSPSPSPSPDDDCEGVSCNTGGPSPTPSPSVSPSPQSTPSASPDPSPSTGSSSSSNNSGGASSNSSSGQVLGASTLAATGNAWQLIMLAGLLFTSTGIWQILSLSAKRRSR